MPGSETVKKGKVGEAGGILSKEYMQKTRLEADSQNMIGAKDKLLLPRETRWGKRVGKPPGNAVNSTMQREVQCSAL